MRCPFCGEDQNKVLDSRESEEGRAVRRRRECEKCERRFTTYERIANETVPLVVKRDGSRQEFDREKVLRVLHLACKKRPVADDSLQRIADEVERALGARGEREVAASQIGELVMKELKALDHIAYVRYASVYRDFQDPEEFKHAVESLKAEKG